MAFQPLPAAAFAPRSPLALLPAAICQGFRSNASSFPSRPCTPPHLSLLSYCCCYSFSLSTRCLAASLLLLSLLLLLLLLLLPAPPPLLLLLPCGASLFSATRRLRMFLAGALNYVACFGLKCTRVSNAGGDEGGKMGKGCGNSLALFLTAVRLVFSCKLIP